jgi:hypothetical protein
MDSLMPPIPEGFVYLLIALGGVFVVLAIHSRRKDQ